MKGGSRSAERLLLAAAPPWSGPLVAGLAQATRGPVFSEWDRPEFLEPAELKYDGFRAVIAKDGARVSLRYRTGREVSERYPEIVEAVRALPRRQVLLDGELVVFGEDGRSSFDLLRGRALRGANLGVAAARSRLAVCAFDVLSVDGRDLRGLPLTSRKLVLRDVLSDGDRRLVFVEHVEAEGERLFAGARALRLEGVVGKKADAPCRAGYRGLWVKCKVEVTEEFVVIGIAAPSRATFDRPGLVLARPGATGWRYAGRVAVGGRELEALTGLLRQIERRRPPCPGAGRAEVWMEPAVVCEVRFLAEGLGLRHAVFVRFRPDRTLALRGG